MDSVAGVTPLTQAEFAALSPKRAKVPAIRASHHRMATLHAAGFTAAQISDLTGRSLTDIRNYPKVPANAELISQKQIELLATDEEADPAAAKLKAMVRIHVRALDRLYDLVDDDANE